MIVGAPLHFCEKKANCQKQTKQKKPHNLPILPREICTQEIYTHKKLKGRSTQNFHIFIIYLK